MNDEQLGPEFDPYVPQAQQEQGFIPYPQYEQPEFQPDQTGGQHCYWSQPPTQPQSGGFHTGSSISPQDSTQMYFPPMPQPQPHPQMTTILVFGLMSVFMMPFLGPFAVKMGMKALKEIDANPHYTGRSAILAGLIAGIIGTIELLLITGFIILIIIGIANY